LLILNDEGGQSGKDRENDPVRNIDDLAILLLDRAKPCAIKALVRQYCNHEFGDIGIRVMICAAMTDRRRHNAQPSPSTAWSLSHCSRAARLFGPPVGDILKHREERDGRLIPICFRFRALLSLSTSKALILWWARLGLNQ
jgi:hypothetical protein